MHLFKDLKGTCPLLKFDGQIASCIMAGLLVPIGDGCCIKARAFKDGEVYDYASLPRQHKYFAAQKLRKGVQNEVVAADRD
jgi:hypothetical protein